MKINILVIEDHEADTELIKYYLNEAGFKHNFFSSETLSEVIDIIRENKIDLVLLFSTVIFRINSSITIDVTI